MIMKLAQNIVEHIRVEIVLLVQLVPGQHVDGIFPIMGRRFAVNITEGFVIGRPPW